jgi:hypothetical protein
LPFEWLQSSFSQKRSWSDFSAAQLAIQPSSEDNAQLFVQTLDFFFDRGSAF